jgi:hypothetical protein
LGDYTSLTSHDVPLGNIRAADENHDGHEDQEDQYHEEQAAEDGHHEDEG